MGKYLYNNFCQVCPKRLSSKTATRCQKHRSAEHAKKLGESVAGHIPWNKGKTGGTPWNKGKKMSAEFRKKCSEAHLKGAPSSSKLRRLERNRAEYYEWRKAVMVEGNYRCSKCLQRGGKLHAHHMYTYNRYPALRYNVNNGIVLCDGCHKRIHKEFGQNPASNDYTLWFIMDNQLAYG